MSEPYTPNARRAIFAARQAAMERGSRCIESEHVLLGILGEGKSLETSLWNSHGGLEAIHTEIEAKTLHLSPYSGAAEVPLSEESKRIFSRATITKQVASTFFSEFWRKKNHWRPESSWLTASQDWS